MGSPAPQGSRVKSAAALHRLAFGRSLLLLLLLLSFYANDFDFCNRFFAVFDSGKNSSSYFATSNFTTNDSFVFQGSENAFYR